jgi:hypothetical protein
MLNKTFRGENILRNGSRFCARRRMGGGPGSGEGKKTGAAAIAGPEAREMDRDPDLTITFPAHTPGRIALFAPGRKNSRQGWRQIAPGLK